MGKVIIDERYIEMMNNQIETLKAGVKLIPETPLLRSKFLPKHLTEKPKSDNVKRFELITAQMSDIYARKNEDYGNSFDESLDEDGLLVAKIRLGDKFRRFSQLIKNPAEVKDESIRDTLIDNAVYSILTIMWMDLQDEKTAMDQMRETTEVYNREDLLKDKERGRKNLHTSDSIKRALGIYSPSKTMAEVSCGADFDGDTLRVFTEEELQKVGPSMYADEIPVEHYTSSDQDLMNKAAKAGADLDGDLMDGGFIHVQNEIDINKKMDALSKVALSGVNLDIGPVEQLRRELELRKVGLK